MNTTGTYYISTQIYLNKAELKFVRVGKSNG
jgi:hypothetical protein